MRAMTALGFHMKRNDYPLNYIWSKALISMEEGTFPKVITIGDIDPTLPHINDLLRPNAEPKGSKNNIVYYLQKNECLTSTDYNCRWKILPCPVFRLILHICFIYEGNFVFLYSFCVDEKLLLSSDRKDIIIRLEIYPYLDYRRFLQSFPILQQTNNTCYSFFIQSRFNGEKY